MTRELIAQAEAFDEEVEYWSRVGNRIFNGNILAEHFKFRADELRAQAAAAHPDPRIAELEGLLREALSCIHYARRAQGLDKPEIEQRIEAALGGK
jgi:hypothetical protein